MLFRRHIRDFTRDMIEQLGLFQTVHLSRETVITREMLPCCKIWTPREGGPTITIGVPNFRATTDLVVQIVIEGSNDEDNANYLDEMCEVVILYLVEDPTWQVQFEYLTNLETEIETNSEGEVRTITGTITFTLQWNYLFITRIHDHLATLSTEVNTIGDPAGAKARFVLARQP
jgi:hypothetical protein